MEWCPVCCSRHAAGSPCPGSLMASGPERQGRRFQIVQGSRVEYCGVLIAEAGEHWRARILTYPNMLWSVPGGRGTIKFAGATPDEAERLAVAFIREHSKARGLSLNEAKKVVEAGRVEPERNLGESPQRAKEERHPKERPIRFGEQKASQTARTGDFSHNGLFIMTDKLLPQGRRLKLVLELEDYTVPLIGKVAWVRTRVEAGRPVGMGIQLIQVPHLYTRYVEAMKDQEPGAEGSS